jgi:undecaprenyl diphosphate synthase
MFFRKYTENYSYYIAIIMDGNGRWARKKKLQRFWGHYIGAKKAFCIIQQLFNIRLKHLTLYTFSLENWKRNIKEIIKIFNILYYFVMKYSNIFIKKYIKIYLIGLSFKVPIYIKNTCYYYYQNNFSIYKMYISLAISYGGKQDIFKSLKILLFDNIKKNIYFFNIYSLEQIFTYNSEFKDPDLIIRCGQHKRISNFLLWQISYSELIFIKINWPSFSTKKLSNMLKFYKFNLKNFGIIRDNTCL